MSAKREPATLRPPFDPRALARESEAVLRAASPTRRDSQLPTTPVIRLDECQAALRDLAASEPRRTESGFRIARAPSSPLLVSSEDVPYLVLSRSDLEWFEFDGPTVAVLLRVDGVSNVEAIAESCRTHFDGVCAILGDLAERDIVAFH